MKYFLQSFSVFVLIIAILFISCNESQNKSNRDSLKIDSITNGINNKNKSDYFRLGLIGKVKSIIETNYKAVDHFGQIETSDLVDKTIYKFNDFGMRIEKSIYQSNGSMDFKIVDSYNEKHIHTESLVYYSDGTQETVKYKFDSVGNILENRIYNSDGKLLKAYVNEFDCNGNKVKESVVDSTFKPISISIPKFDEKRHLLNEDVFDKTGKLVSRTTFEYTYFDKSGNWTNLIEYENGIPKTISEREIQYYDSVPRHAAGRK